MKINRITFITLFLIVSLHTKGQGIKLSRICNGGIPNTIYWQITNDTCTLLNSIKIIGRDIASIPFFKIDSGIDPAIKTYIHNNANNPSIKDWQYCIEYYQKCGNDTIVHYSDTLYVDSTPPDSTILDSVSVDPNTGVIYIGWTSNKTSDFSSYYLYNTDRSDPRLIENFKDTFYTDINPIDPRSKSLTYDITSSDSCDNRRSYGVYFHKTICLKGQIDTCKNKVQLNWNPYVGWESRIFYIYKKINSGPFTILDSTSQYSYIDNNVTSGATVAYFVRAYSKSPLSFSSSSNSTFGLQAGKSVNPSGTKLNYVTNNSSNQIEIQASLNPISNYSTLELFRFTESNTAIKIGNVPLSTNVYIDGGADNKVKYNYFTISYNTCKQPSDTSPVSNNIVLQLNYFEANVTLNWDRYFTWNTGVKEYVIFRSSGNNEQEASSFTAWNTTIDTFLNTQIGDTPTYCFYILAYENSGSNTSKSNTACYTKSSDIFFPNAIVPDGINKAFTFYGSGLDLEKSKLTVFNRWGAVVFEKENIKEGWNGKDNAGNDLEAEVYFFNAEVFQIDKQVKIHGRITILR